MSIWPLQTLEALTDPQRPITYGVVKPGDERPVDGVRFIRGGDVFGGRINIPALRTITQSVSEQYRRTLLQGGELLVSLVGYPGEVAVAPHALEGANLARQVGLVALRKDIDAHFVKYVLMSPQGRAALLVQTGGTAQQVINLANLKRIAIPVPPLPTQRRIASILGAYDDLIEVNRRRIAVLEEMARRLFDEWFVRFRFSGAATTALTHHEHGPLPDGWAWVELQQLCTKRNGIQTGPFGSQLHQSDYTDFGVPVVMPKNLVDLRVQQNGIARIPEALADSLSRHRLQPGDIVYGRRGDIGRRAFVSKREDGWFCGTGCLRLRPDPPKIEPRYLFAALGLPVTEGMIRGRAQGVTMPNLSAGVMASISILCPPGDLQSSFARFAGGVGDLISALHMSAECLSASRDLLLPRLISGTLSVTTAEQELADAA